MFYSLGFSWSLIFAQFFCLFCLGGGRWWFCFFWFFFSPQEGLGLHIPYLFFPVEMTARCLPTGRPIRVNQKRKTRYVIQCCLQILLAWCVPGFAWSEIAFRNLPRNLQNSFKLEAHNKLHNQYLCSHKKKCGRAKPVMPFLRQHDFSYPFRIPKSTEINDPRCRVKVICRAVQHTWIALGHSMFSTTVVQRECHPEAFLKGREAKF